MNKPTSTTKTRLAAKLVIIREEMASEAKAKAQDNPQTDIQTHAQTESQATIDAGDLGVVAFLESESGQAHFGPIDPAALQMPPPSLEKLLKFRQALADAATPENAHLVPTADAVRKFGANLPKIH